MLLKLSKFVKIFKEQINKLENKEVIGFIGIIGSLNLKHDIDCIILPGKTNKKGEYIKTYFTLLRNIKEKMKKEELNLIPFYHFDYQEEVDFLSKRKENSIFLHNIFYLNNPFVKKTRDAYKIVNQYRHIDQIIKDIKIEIFGDINGAKKSPLVPCFELDGYYEKCIHLFPILANYPKKLIQNKVTHTVHYIKKQLGKEKRDIRKIANKLSFEDCVKEYEKVLYLLDQQSKIK